MIITVDGTAASGKGTIAKRLAQHYGLAHLDTGALYRAVARDTLAAGQSLEDGAAAARAAGAIDPESLADPALRGPEAGEAASVVAVHKEVRAALLDFQRAFAARPPGAVLDGRDIGTVVCPDADVKLFVTASAEVRAERRHLELRARGEDVAYENVLDAIRLRDTRDTERAEAPLLPAEDAHLLDTSNLDIEAAFNAAVDLVDAATGRAGCAS